MNMPMTGSAVKTGGGASGSRLRSPARGRPRAAAGPGRIREIEQSAGTIDCEDTGGDGPVIVLLHGLMMDVSLWDGLIGDLSADER